MLTLPFPSFLRLEDPLHVNALVRAQRALDLRTETPAVVLRAPVVAQASLESVQAILTALRSLPTPPGALPVVLSAGIEGESAFLVLGEMRGQPLRDRLLRLALLSEDDLLQIAQAHISILQALHQIGYAGWQPTANDIWWSAEGERTWLRFLGWEWIAPSLESTDLHSDLVAAAATWIELLTGISPSFALSVQQGPGAWLQVSLGLRRLLVDLWQARGEADLEQILQILEKLSRLRRLESDELVRRGRTLIETDPALAIDHLTIAAQRKPPPPHIDEILQQALAQADAPMQLLLAQGRQNIRLGRYPQATAILKRAANLPTLSPTRLLTLARWRTLAEALQQAVEANLIAHGVSVIDQLSEALIRVVELAEQDEFESAHQQLDQVMDRIPAQLMPRLHHLLAIQADLAIHQAIQLAQDAEKAKNFTLATVRYGEAVHMLKDISYQAELEAVLGSMRERYERCQRAQRRREQHRERTLALEQAVSQGRENEAAQLARLAVGLAHNETEHKKLLIHAHRLECRWRVRQHIILPAHIDLISTLPMQAAEALAAIETLQHFHPDDLFGQKQQNLWLVLLLKLSAIHSEAAMQCAALLAEYFKTDSDANSQCRQMAQTALSQWQNTYSQIKSGLNYLKRPAEFRNATQRLGKLRHDVEKQSWVASYLAPGAYWELREEIQFHLTELESKYKEIQSQRQEYERELAAGRSCQLLLAQVQATKLELYDDPEMAGHLLPHRLLPSADEQLLSANLAIAAYRALLQGEVKFATRAFTHLLNQEGISDQIRETAQIGQEIALTLPSSTSAMAEISDQWQQQVDYAKLVLDRVREIVKLIGEERREMGEVPLAEQTDRSSPGDKSQAP